MTVASYTDQGALALAKRNLNQGFPGGTPKRMAGIGTGAYEATGAGSSAIHFASSLAASLRANEMGADVLMKATRVDGVYSADPKKDPSARRFDRLTHSQAIEGGYKVMDATAFALARETSLPIIIFSISEPGSIGAILRGAGHGTIVAG